MLESKVYEKFKSEWDGRYIARIETKKEDGIPDVLVVTTKRKSVFIELKTIQKQIKNTRKTPLRASQHLWFVKYPSTAYVLLAIENIFFLFNRNQVIEYLCKRIDYEGCKANSIIYSDNMKEIVKKINS